MIDSNGHHGFRRRDAMSGEAMPLSVVPGALQGASTVISAQSAPLATPSSGEPTSMEAAALAGAALDTAIDGYCAAFAQRLSTMAARLAGAASAYTAQEAANSQAVAALSPGEVV
jgi:hypothetical protein